MFRSRKHTHAFTLVELLVSISIFALMTTLVVAKYGNFNNNVLLTNAAYDVALAIRTAQTYGLSVRSDDSGGFNNAYGVNFSIREIGEQINELSNIPNSQTIVTFSDLNANGIYDQGEEISYSTLRGGVRILDIAATCCDSVACVTQCFNVGSSFDVVFKRPDPSAQMCSYNGSVAGRCGLIITAQIMISSPSGDYRFVSIRKNGQISVNDSGLEE
ncbi:MAG: prepilin-type N-terminal cleavage/methylation domain-containing protein [Candidatus Pacebacteria bacterium]|nr:prepilin-type N-terminal cleavage/methylation domain-containing protein [Candidatus Paceibacterota bacterium]